MKKDEIKNNKTAVLMSGGVDSSVSALLLKKQGFKVTGFFMKLQSCRKSEEALRDAKKAAKQISIPFYVVDGKDIFQKRVINYFIDEYNNLRTPNPCVKCNRLIKFGWFFKEAKKRGFDKVATGHYAQVKKDKDGIFHLLSGRDKNKDQSYFLHYLRQDQLAKVIFPVGNLQKDETRKIAKENNLSVSEKKESQEICFVPGDNYRKLLKKYSASNYFQPGNIINSLGEIMGRHNGLANYTIGQRKGLGNMSIKDENRPPMFVLGFDKKKNELIVGLEKDLYRNETLLKDINWLSNRAKKVAVSGKELTVKIRYRQKSVPCVIKKARNKFKLMFKKPQRAITPGQSAVFYWKNEVLGGGIIV